MTSRGGHDRWTIEPVRSRGARRAFLDLPGALEQQPQSWVPPLRSDARHLLGAANPVAREGAVEHWLCRAQGQVLGRIAGIIHEPFLRRHRMEAQFGAFDVVPDEEVALALLRTVEAWAKARGLTRVVGPYTYAATGDVGLLTHAISESPVLFQPSNPAYYPELLHVAGYRRQFTAHAYTWTWAHHAAPARRLVERGEEVIRRQGFRVRGLDVRRFSAEVELLYDLYNRSFTAHPETTPVPWDVFRSEAGALRRLSDPSLTRIIELDGSAVAFVVLLPNFAPLLRRYGGRLRPGFVLQVRKAARRSEGAVVLMMGADPAFVGTGVGRVIAGEIVRTCVEGRCSAIHTTWVHERNRNSRALVNAMGAPPAKTYGVFGRDLLSGEGAES